MRVRDGLVMAGFVLAVSVAAFVATAHNCSTTDGSFTLADGKPSAYCRLTDLFPPALDSVHGIVVSLLLFGGPLLTVLAATVVCTRRRRPPPGRLLLAALVASLFTLFFSLFGSVGFIPYD
jgi:hypothetical protein